MEDDSGGCKCVDEGGGIGGRHKNISEIEMESSGISCNTDLCLWFGDSGIGRETTQATSLQEQLSEEDCGSQEGG